VDTVTMRLRWYSWPILPLVCGIAVCIGMGFVSHGAFGVAAILAVVWVIIRFGAKIEVTPTHVNVRVWMGYPRAARTLRTLRESARRDAIYAMHWYGGSLTFVNDGQWVLLGFPSAGWTRGQLLDLSEILGVCLYNHRTKHGWGKDAWDGQLMQRGDRARH
jgi:hypothetical protein